MSRPVTAAAIRTASLAVRLPIGFDMKVAAADASLAPEVRLLCRLAARMVLGLTDSPDMDIIARLQILEGAKLGSSGRKPNAGTWWKKGRRGLAMARDAYAGTNIDPSWLSASNTGLISKTFAMVKSKYHQWAGGGSGHSSPDSVMQNGIMGLTKDSAGLLKHGPLFFSFAASSSTLHRNIASGQDTPQGIAGAAAKNFVQKVDSEFTKGDRLPARTSPVTETGESVFDQMSSNPRSFFKVLADLLADPRSGVHKSIKDAMVRQFGQGRWADLAAVIVTKELRGDRYSKQDLAREWDMAPGTLSKVIRTKIKPAIAKLQKDRRFLGELRDIGELAMMRLAHQKLVEKLQA